MVKRFKIIIIGSGPGGLCCGIQLKRYGLDFLMFERDEIGGLAINANRIMNYLGFPSGINGMEFCNLLKDQIKENKIKIIFENITLVNYNNRKEEFNVFFGEDQYCTEILVMATGSKPKKPNFIISPKSPWIFFKINQIRNVKNKDIVIIGGGDLAFDYALSMAEYNRIRIINRSKDFCALDILIKEVLKNKNIKTEKNLPVKEVIETQKGLILDLEERGRSIRCDYLIVAAGREPRLDILSSDMVKNKNKLIKSKKLYIIGDAKDSYLRQISIAAGEGIKAAMEIFWNIERSRI